MIAERSLDVVVAGENPEVVLLLVVHPRLAQEPAVVRVGVPDHLRREGIVDGVHREMVTSAVHSPLRYQFSGPLCDRPS